MERVNIRMHDLPQQDGVHILSVPSFLKLETKVFLIYRYWSGRLLDRKWSLNFHANVLIVTLNI